MLATPEKDDRVFAPFPIEMDEHPKIIGLSDAAFRALFEGTFYARRMLSDGFLDERVVLRRWGADVAAELASNDPERPSWVRVDGVRPGWRIHDFEKHHPLRAEIEAKRADVSTKRAEAGRKGAAKRWQANGKGMANDSSESESESELKTDLTSISSQSVTPLAVDNFRTDSIQESEEQIAGARALAATQKLDLEKIRQLAFEQCARDLTFGEALRLGNLIVSKSRVRVSKPTAYVVRAFNEPFEVQQLIDKDVRT